MIRYNVALQRLIRNLITFCDHTEMKQHECENEKKKQLKKKRLSFSLTTVKNEIE